MTEAIYPQCRIVTERLLNPDTTEKILNLIVEAGGVRRMVLNGPRLPAIVPYGPARGTENPHTLRREINVGGQEIQLEVHVGTIILELTSTDVIPALKEASDKVFTDFSYRIQEGKFMKTDPSLADYAKFGPDADRDLIGMSDPKSKKGPVIIQGL